MKKIFLFFCMLLFSACMLAQAPMRVKKIKGFVYKKDTCMAYLIYATRNDSNFVFISHVREKKERGAEIKKRKWYVFDLKKLYPYDGEYLVFGMQVASPSPYLWSYGLEPQEKYHNKIYVSTNTNGKYMLKE